MIDNTGEERRISVAHAGDERRGRDDGAVLQRFRGALRHGATVGGTVRGRSGRGRGGQRCANAALRAHTDRDPQGTAAPGLRGGDGLRSTGTWQRWVVVPDAL